MPNRELLIISELTRVSRLSLRSRALSALSITEAYEGNSLSQCLAKGVKDAHSWIEALGPVIVATSGLI